MVLSLVTVRRIVIMVVMTALISFRTLTIMMTTITRTIIYSTMIVLGIGLLNVASYTQQ